jgi:hypothetical protein
MSKKVIHQGVQTAMGNGSHIAVFYQTPNTPVCRDFCNFSLVLLEETYNGK